MEELIITIAFTVFDDNLITLQRIFETVLGILEAHDVVGNSLDNILILIMPLEEISIASMVIVRLEDLVVDGINERLDGVLEN